MGVAWWLCCVVQCVISLAFFFLGLCRVGERMTAVQEQLWDSVVQNIQPPSNDNKRWGKVSDSSLAVVIVEPREHPWLRGVLYNMAHVYGGRNDVSLYILHGSQNEDFVKEITRGWQNVVYINQGYSNLTLAMYNQLLTSLEFWENFTSEFVLIFQTDTLIRRPIDKVFFQYDYVGAPWGTQGVGNGGFSLRRVETMKQLCRKNKPTAEPEDLFFFFNFRRLALVGDDTGYRLPTPSDARSFSVEHVYHDNPCGMHQAYRFHTLDKVARWLQDLPGRPIAAHCLT
jgi:hypothetical protein